MPIAPSREGFLTKATLMFELVLMPPANAVDAVAKKNAAKATLNLIILNSSKRLVAKVDKLFEISLCTEMLLENVNRIKILLSGIVCGYDKLLSNVQLKPVWLLQYRRK